MKLHYRGKYKDEDSLPHGEHMPGAVQFKEVEDTKQLGRLANTVALVLLFVLAVPAVLRGIGHYSILQGFFGFTLPMLTLFPHELLHAICFREDVYLYTNLRQGLLFVVGPETMSKSRFIFMSLLPSIVFGAIPYILGLIFPQYIFLMIFGAICLSMGAGDYYNVYNTVVQMPKGARTYLYKMHSFWYLPAQ